MAQDALYHRRRVRDLPLLRHWSRYRKLPVSQMPMSLLWLAKKGLEDETVDASRPPLFQLFGAPDMDMTPVRINISLPKCVLEGLDRKASARGMTRSALIAKAAQAYM